MLEKMNILRLFFEDPVREFNVREVARELKISPATASKMLKGLAKDGLLKERKQRTFKFYSADIDSESYRDLKVYYNIKKIRESGLIEAINRFYLKPTILLFGSAADGLDTKDSDIDVIIIAERTDMLQDREVYEKKLGRGLQIFIVKNIKELRNEHLINNALNGITIQGGVKWI